MDQSKSMRSQMNNGRRNEVWDWYRNLPQEGRHTSGVIAAVEQRIKTETDQENLRTLQFILASEYGSHGRHVDAESVYLQLHHQMPHEPMPLILLAEQKLYYQEKPSDAMETIERAIPIAMQSGHFRRHALGVKARIALALFAYDVVEDVLKQLMQLKFTRGNADCAIERDFLDRLPPGAINEEVARAYDEHSASAKKS